MPNSRQTMIGAYRGRHRLRSPLRRLAAIGFQKAAEPCLVTDWFQRYDLSNRRILLPVPSGSVAQPLVGLVLVITRQVLGTEMIGLLSFHNSASSKRVSLAIRVARRGW